MAIKYAAERITVGSAQLTAWSGWVAGDSLNLAGPCPTCGHDSPDSVPLRVSALEGAAVQTTHSLTVALKCTCDQAHPGRPDDVTGGCGRNWSVTAEITAAEKVSLSPLTDPGLLAAAEALRNAASGQLAELRVAAEKWIAGVTAIYTLFGLAGIAIARDTLSKLATGWQVGIAVMATIAVALAGLSVYWTYRAAYGWPVTRPVRDDDELRDWYTARQAAPSIQADLLKCGVRAAAGSLAVLVTTVALLWFAPLRTTASSPAQVTLADGSQLCGTLMPAPEKETLRIRKASDGIVVPISVSMITALTIVAECLCRKYHLLEADSG